MLTLGPPFPKTLFWHSMLEIHGDAFVFGGRADWVLNQNEGDQLSEIYKISCSSGICSLSIINQTLKVPRETHVAIHVPDSFCTQ